MADSGAEDVERVHEYSIVRALLDRVEQEASAHGADRVARIELAVGALAGVEPALLEAAFELAREGTRAARAELALRSVPARWLCRGCAADLDGASALRCPACGAPARLAAGDEIVLERLELEVA